MAKKPTRSAAPRSSAARPRAAAKPAASRKPRSRTKAAVQKPAAVATAPGPVKLKTVITLTHDQIARRAYEIWMARGCPFGMDAENWQEAERQLRSETPAHN